MVLGCVGAAAVSVLALAGRYLYEDEAFRVYTVDIQSADTSPQQSALLRDGGLADAHQLDRTTPRVPTAHLRHLVDVRQGQHLATINTADVARAVERHPWIASATVRMELPSTLRVTVTEHEPVMMVALDALWYVDADGRPFHRADTADLDYPTLTGIDADLVDGHPEIASAIVGRALGLLRDAAAPPLHGTAAISEVRFHRRTGFTVVLRSGTELLMGFQPPNEPLARLDLMVQQGLDLSTPQRIDLNAASVAIATPLPDVHM